jgi:hypothetical protein
MTVKGMTKSRCSRTGSMADSSSVVPVASVYLLLFNGRCIGSWSSWWGPVTKLHFSEGFRNERHPPNNSVHVRTFILIIFCVEVNLAKRRFQQFDLAQSSDYRLIYVLGILELFSEV